MMNRIAREADQLLAERSAARQLDGPLPVAESLVEAASHIAAQVAAKLTVVATTSGRTALLLSKQRSRTPTLGVSDCAATVRRMCLYWGVYPFAARRFSDNQELLTHLSGWARAKGLLSTGDRVVLIAGSNWTSAEHNMIAVANVS
jgi:pyruvate kinase